MSKLSEILSKVNSQAVESSTEDIDEKFEDGQKNLRKLFEFFRSTYFGAIEYYLDKMSKEKDENSDLYSKAKSSYGKFWDEMKKLQEDLDKLPNFK